MSTIHVKPEDTARPYGPRLPLGAARACRGCGRSIDPAQRGHVCKACRVRKSRGVEVGPACVCCGFSDRRMLCRRTVDGAVVTLCGNCATLLGRRTMTLQALQAERGAARAA